MPITVVKSNSDGVVHGTDNNKKTGCGIRYNTGDNARKYTQGEVLNDLILAMKTLNCEKCRRVLSSKMIKEDRKAENKREKEEKKRIAEAIKRGELDEDGNPIVKPEENTEEVSTTETSPVNEPVQVAQTNQPEPVQVTPQVKETPIVQSTAPTSPQIQVDDDISQFIVNPSETQHQDNYYKPTQNLQVDDDIAQFMVNPKELKSEEPKPVKKKQPDINNINDILADLDNMMSHMTKETTKAPTVEKVSPVEVPTVEEVSSPILEDVSPVEVPSVEDVYAPVLEDVSPVEVPTVEDVYAPVLEDVSPVEVPTVEEVSSPILEDISPVEVPSVEDVYAPVLEDVSPVEVPTVEEVSSPVLEDVSLVEVPTVEEVSSPVLEDVSPVEVPTVEEVSSPVLEDVSPVEVPTVEKVSSPVLEDVSPVEVPTVEEVSSPILEDVSPVEVPTVEKVSTSIPNPNIAPVQMPQNQAIPIPNYAQPVVNQGFVQPTPNVYNQQSYVQQPIPQAPLQFYYNAYGEAIPITYNAQNQPVFTVPVTYDVQGQPRPMQMSQPTMPISQPYVAPQPQPQPQPQPTYQAPTTPPVSTTPPPTRVVRADAPPLISKPSENKPFDFSVFEKETTSPVFSSSENRIFADSIEEALNQLGVETETKKEDNDIIPDFQEYVAPTKSNKPKTKPTPKPVENKPELSEAERKKREKIDAKLRKEWEKKGLDPNAWKRMKH